MLIEKLRVITRKPYKGHNFLKDQFQLEMENYIKNKIEKNNNNFSSGTKLCNALQDMGTTFIKLGQFLATRPDIIGEEIAKELENHNFSKNEIDTLKKQLIQFTNKIISDLFISDIFFPSS